MKKHFDKNLIMTEGKENFQLSKNLLDMRKNH